MSLLQLPIELIAQMASHLEYEDVCNFMESSKRNYNTVKRYKADRIRLVLLMIHPGETAHGLLYRRTCGAKSCDNTVWLNYEYKLSVKGEENSDCFIKQVLDKCDKAGDLYLGHTLNSDVAGILADTKTKISKFCIESPTIDMSANEFVSLCKRFNRINITHVELPDHLWNDEVLCQLLPRIEYRRGREDAKHFVGKLTDRTLKALVQDNCVADIFLFNNFHNSFTIQEVVNVLKKTLKLKKDVIRWDLGVLRANQAEDARRYFDKEHGEMSEFYKIEMKENEDIIDYWLSAHPTGRTSQTGDQPENEYATKIHFNIAVN